MSQLSTEAIQGLESSSMELSALETRVEEVSRMVLQGALTVGQARTQLAQVEAQANKVECNKIDSIYTSELNSGKIDAKAEKKAQLVRLENLAKRLEEQFAWLKTLEA